MEFTFEERPIILTTNKAKLDDIYSTIHQNGWNKVLTEPVPISIPDFKQFMEIECQKNGTNIDQFLLHHFNEINKKEKVEEVTEDEGKEEKEDEEEQPEFDPEEVIKDIYKSNDEKMLIMMNIKYSDIKKNVYLHSIIKRFENYGPKFFKKFIIVIFFMLSDKYSGKALSKYTKYLNDHGNDILVGNRHKIYERATKYVTLIMSEKHSGNELKKIKEEYRKNIIPSIYKFLDEAVKFDKE